MTPDEQLRALAREYAIQEGLDPEDFANSVIRARDRRRRNGQRPFKHCSMCREHLPARAFAEASDSPDGLQRVCRECNADYQRRYRERAKTPPGA